MNVKPLTIAGVALFGVLGLYVASAKPEKPNNARVTNKAKVIAAVKHLKSGKKDDAKKKKQVLVFSRTMGYRHKSIDLGKQTLQIMADATGAFEVVISDDLANFDEGNIERFDAICFLNTTMSVFSPSEGALKTMSAEDKEAASELELARKANLMKFITDGKGFIGIHSATDTFYEWPEYGKMLGGYFDGHPWRSSMEVSIKADKNNKEHALLDGVIPADKGELRFKEEIYQFKDPYDSKAVTMLLRLDSDKSDKPKKGIKRTDKDFGVSWVKPHGEGRVFYSSLGHNDHIYWNNNVIQHYYSGILYALGE